jgi:hypothetical protein
MTVMGKAFEIFSIKIWIEDFVLEDMGVEKRNNIHTWKIKCQLDATDSIFIAKLIVRSKCFGGHYAHHQELKNYTGFVSDT